MSPVYSLFSSDSTLYTYIHSIAIALHVSSDSTLYIIAMRSIISAVTPHIYSYSSIIMHVSSLSPQKHANPCYYKTTKEATYSILPKDQWKDLSNGDCISLLPNGELAFRIASKEHLSSSLSTEFIQTSSHYPTSDSQSHPQMSQLPVPPSTSDVDPQQSHPDPSTTHNTTPPAPCNDPVDDMLFGDMPSSPGTKDTYDNSETNAKKLSLGQKLSGEFVSEVEDNRQAEGSEDGVVAAKLLKSDSEEKHSHSSKPIGSTNKRRVLPGWLTIVPADESTSTAKKGSSSRAGSAKNKKPPSSGRAKGATNKRRIVERSESPVDDADTQLPPAKV